MNHAQARIIIAFSAGLCIGGGIGFVLAKQHLRAETEKEIDGVKNLYRRLREEDAAKARADWNPPTEDDSEEEAASDNLDGVTPESLAQEAVNLGYINADDVTVKRDPNYIAPEYTEAGDKPFPTPNQVEDDLREDVEYVHNLRFINPDNGDEDDVTKWDRSSYVPYVITEAEFRIDFPQHEKLSLRYYKGDHTLCEDDETYIPDLEGTVGEDNLQYFGLASGDERVLHIRNERVGADFEVTLYEGSYKREVLGFQEEDLDEESIPRTIKKMRHRE